MYTGFRKLLVSCKMHADRAHPGKLGRFGALPHSYLYFAFCKLGLGALQVGCQPTTLLRWPDYTASTVK